MGTKKKRLEGLLCREIGAVVQQQLGDPRLGFITIASVELSRDFKFAKVYFSAIQSSGGEEPANKIRMFERVLNHAAPTVQKHIAKELKLRHTPKVRFVFTDGLRRSFEISQLIKEARDSDMDHI